ncbi:MAG: GH25 family lysozyme, partial [Oscillospiraceae bacterium]
MGNDVEIIEGGGYDWKREEKNAVSPPPISPPLSTEQYKIIDISKWNADIDFEEIKAHNCNNVIIRGASWNNATAPYIDEYFEKNYLKAKEANLKVGFYYTTYAVNALEADLEVNLVLQLLKGKQFELPVFIDVEVKQLHEHTYQTKQYNAELIDYALSKISAKGYFVGIYIGNDFINNYVDMSMLTKYDIWLAHYVDESRKNKIAHTIWQWGGEYFDKMNKNLDSNIAYKDYSFIEKQGLNGFAKVELPIEPPSDTTDLIINGLKAENKVLLDENGKLHLDIDNLSSENTVLNKSIEEKNDKISNLTLLLLKVEKSNKQLLLEVE